MLLLIYWNNLCNSFHKINLEKISDYINYDILISGIAGYFENKRVLRLVHRSLEVWITIDGVIFCQEVSSKHFMN